MLVVDHRDATRALTMRRAIETMRETLVALEHGDVQQPLRTVMRLPGDRDALYLMPSSVRGTLGVKVLTAFSGNGGTGYDTHQGAVLLFGAHGELLAMVDATAVTAVRTAAVSGVATDALAREDAAVLAVLGSGAQAMAHVEAVLAVRPIADVRVWSRSPSNAGRFARDASARFGIPVTAYGSIEEAVRDADVICTTTAAREPILQGEWLTPGAHVNAVGSGSPVNREVDGATMTRSRIYVDRMESAMREAGDVLLAIAEGAIAADDIVGDIGGVLAGRLPGRRAPDEITLFKSVGLGAEDVAAARATYDECIRLGLGREVAFGALSS